MKRLPLVLAFLLTSGCASTTGAKWSGNTCPKFAGANVGDAAFANTENSSKLPVACGTQVAFNVPNIIWSEFCGFAPAKRLCKSGFQRGFPLLLPRCPSAVFGTISQKRIDSIKAVVAGWPATHVGEKVLVRFPSFANAYSSFRIQFLVPMVWVVAPEKHCRPSPMFGASGIPVGRFYLGLDHAASARFSRTTVKQSVLFDALNPSAFARALPNVVVTCRSARA